LLAVRVLIARPNITDSQASTYFIRARQDSSVPHILSSVAGRKTRETRYSRHSRPGNPTLAFLRSLASRARLAIHLQRDHSPHNIRGKFDYALICQNRCPPYNIRGKFDTPFIRILYAFIYTLTLQLYSSAAAGPIETNKTPPCSSRLGQQLSSISERLSLKTKAV
jgi:hypothetical protein